VFIVKAEQYFEFGLLTSLLETNLAAVAEHIIESD